MNKYTRGGLIGLLGFLLFLMFMTTVTGPEEVADWTKVAPFIFGVILSVFVLALCNMADELDGRS